MLAFCSLLRFFRTFRSLKKDLSGLLSLFGVLPFIFSLIFPLIFYIPPSLSLSFDCGFLPVHLIVPHQLGSMYTVLHGHEISHIPVEVISILPQAGAHSHIHHLILIRLIGQKLAQGMSGSPVYIDGKLIGAVHSGWENSGHQLALVIPIQSMIDGSHHIHTGHELSLMRYSGFTAENSSLLALSEKLAAPLIPGITPLNFDIRKTPAFMPGSSISVYLVWGDVELSALGTVTAVDKQGNFLAFGHEFLRRGAVQFPCGGAYIHEIVNSQTFPVKLSSSEGVYGTVFHDTDSGISGKSGVYTQSIPCELVFIDTDTQTRRRCTFRTIADENLSAQLISSVFQALCQDAWGRNGEGTITLNLHIDGINLPHGWTRKNIYYSDTDIITEAFSKVKPVITAYLTQPFSHTLPCGFSLTARITQKARVMLIEDIDAPSKAKPGDTINISVRLREWRKTPVTRTFTLKIPDDAKGIVELIVRGGGIRSFEQSAIEGGWKAVTSFENMLSELKAADANNQLILELNADRNTDIIRDITQRNAEPEIPDFLPEEEEYLSDTKQRRIREGTLKIFDSDYFIDGFMRRIIHTEDG